MSVNLYLTLNTIRFSVEIDRGKGQVKRGRMKEKSLKKLVSELDGETILNIFQSCIIYRDKHEEVTASQTTSEYPSIEFLTEKFTYTDKKDLYFLLQQFRTLNPEGKKISLLLCKNSQNLLYINLIESSQYVRIDIEEYRQKLLGELTPEMKSSSVLFLLLFLFLILHVLSSLFFSSPLE